MKLVFITHDVAIDPAELASIQKEVVTEYVSTSPSDGERRIKFSGSVLTLKNGRKIFVSGMDPEAIVGKLI